MRDIDIGYYRFAIPFTLATTLGLAAVALRGDPDMRVLSPADVSAGLPAAAAASALLGKSGAAAMLILLFLAVTSATSAELIAVSSILTYDVYQVCVSFHLLRYNSNVFLVRNTSTLRPLMRNC
jgi:Na+/proline symporter